MHDMKFNKKFKQKSLDNESSVGDDLEEDYQESPKWYEERVEKPKNVGAVTEQVLIELKDEAKKCHETEVANYNLKSSKTNSSHQWMKTVMHKGTVSDKIAAHTVAVQDNPVCNLETLINMVNMVKVGKKKECFTVMETLTDLFLSDLLIPHSKLAPFHTQPLGALEELSSGNGIKRRKILSSWYFEDQLKEVFTTFVLALNRAAQDTVDSNKEKAITAMFKLLCGNPEQEKNLLCNIVNKLGDPSQKVASKTIYCLTQLLFKHPNMQAVVLGEVEKLLFRPNVSPRAQYYCLCFLSQFYLSHEDADLAKKMINVYLAFFKACVKKGEVDSRMMSALLSGINRAYPYSKLEFDDMKDHIDTFFRLVHLANFNIGLQVLTLLLHVTGDKMADRFYSALYRKLLDPKLLTTTHQAILLSLLYKSLLKDVQVDRIKMFIKRLLHISLFVQPSFACGVLYLISQLIQKKPELHAVKLTACNMDRFADEGEEEKYEDVKEEGEEKVQAEASSGWVHKGKTKRAFNALTRNPLFGGASFTAYTELTYLSRHFHPTVALWAQQILQGEKVSYVGDPLKDFTLIRFLERFVFKNPKQLEDKNGAHPTFGKRKFYQPKGVKTLAVNSEDYLRERTENIPVDEQFLHAYIRKKYENKSFKTEEDLESVQSEDFEEMLDKMGGTQEAESDDDLDYMGEIGDSLKKKTESRKKKKQAEEEDSEDDIEDSEDDIEEDFDDEDALEATEEDEEDALEATEEDLELMNDLSDDDEDIEFPSDSESENESKHKRKPKKDVSSIFASAEEFAALLDEEGSSKRKPGGSNAMQNTDKAGQKQLAWEENRNRWIKGFNKAVNKRPKSHNASNATRKKLKK